MRSTPATLHSSRIQSPLGELVAVADDDGVCLLEFADRPDLEQQLATLGAPACSGSNQHLRRLGTELAEYFRGERTRFEVPLRPAGTPFQEAVWRRVRAIPYGATRSYGEIAAELERVNAHRAVGHANGRNRLAILIPCHRVVGSRGELTGYAGGVRRKQALLALEDLA